MIRKKLVAMLMTAAMVVSLAAVPAMADDTTTDPNKATLEATYVDVQVSSQAAGAYLKAPSELIVQGYTAESYGYTDTVTDGVSALDVLVAETSEIFGDDFTTETKDTYLKVSDAGWVTTIFGTETSANGFMINGKCPTDGTKSSYGGYNGITVNQAKVQTEDKVAFYTYGDSTNYTDICASFKDSSAATVKPGDTLEVEVQGYSAAWYGCYEDEIADYTKALEGVALGLMDEETGAITPLDNVETDEDGKASVTFDNAGTYVLAAYGTDATDSPLLIATKTVYVVPEYQDGTYTVSTSINRDNYPWSYPKKNYSFDLTVKVENGKVADLYYTKDDKELKTDSDRNYLIWAMNGHKVGSPDYFYAKYVDKKFYKTICGTGLTEQVIANNGTYGCDTVTGATITSQAILDGVDSALAKAVAGDKDETANERPAADSSEAVVPADGIYYVSASCDSATIHNDEALLFVKDGKMTMSFAMEQREAAYPYLYMGTEEEALAAGEDAWIHPYSDYDYGYKYPGSYYVNVPVESLDKKLSVALYAGGSKNWFNRLITVSSADMVKLSDGEYCADSFTSAGGIHQLAISCGRVYVKDSQVMADIIFPSVKYTDATVNGVTYDPVVDTEAGTTTFTVPVNLNATTKISATTTAMSQPHTIDYTLNVGLNLNNPTVCPADGDYAADNFTFSGGTGKVQITCSKLTVKNGKIYADIAFTSTKYTEAVVNGVSYPTTVDTAAGTSNVTIPVSVNCDFVVGGTTTAMSEAHTIDYTLHIDFDTANPKVIKKASAITLADKTATYTGKTISVAAAKVTGSTGKVTYTYYSDSACTKAVTSHKNAGTYYVKAVVAADDNYEAATSNVAKLVINKKASTITLTARTATYTGKTISVAAAKVTGSTGKVTYTYYSDKNCTKKVTAHVNAGTYYVKASVAADTNYKAAASNVVKLVINPKAATLTVKVASKTLKYTSVKKAAASFSIGASVNSKGKITYKSSGKSVTVTTAGKVTVKKGTKKGTYKITVTAAAKGNYKKATKTVKVTVK